MILFFLSWVIEASPPEKSFRECALSMCFLWHLLWLSVMQLRHYLFIGTLNPMLQRLTMGEPSLGKQLSRSITIRIFTHALYNSRYFYLSITAIQYFLLLLHNMYLRGKDTQLQ